jgi:hypothetical protein
MIHLTTCPRCRRAVTLPEEADAAALVRCPLCNAEYALSEAIPPALVVLPKCDRMTPATSAPPTGLVTEPFFLQGKTIAPPTDFESAVEASEMETPPVEPEVNESPVEVAPSAESPAETGGEESIDSFAFDFSEHLAESESESAEIEESAEAAATDVEPGDLSAVADERPAANPMAILPAKSALPEPWKAPPQAPPPRRPLVKPAPPRRNRKKQGPIRMLVEWILGLGVAVVIGYYGIWWIRGESAGLPRFDWAPFLPAEEHIAQIPVKPTLPASKAKPSPSAPETGVGTRTPAVPANPIDKQETTAGLESKGAVSPDVNPPSAVEAKMAVTPEPESPPPEPQIGPRPPSNFTFFDFDTAIDDASNAYIIKGECKISAENYPAFCRLAEVQTYIAPDKQAPAQRQSVQVLLSNIAKEPEQVAEIGRLAAAAVKNPGEHPGGILLAGKTTKISSNNNMHGAFIKLAGSDETVTVLSANPMTFKVDDEVLVTGGLVVKPAENIRGFKGKAPLAVWLSGAVPIPAAAVKK